MANTENTNETEFPKKNPLSMQIDLAKFAPATDEEKAQQEVMSESTTFFKDGMRKLLKNPLAVGSIIVLILVIAAAVAGPMIVPYGYEEMISVNGRRDKTVKTLDRLSGPKMNRGQLIPERSSFRIFLVQMNSAVIILSVFFMAPEYRCLSDFSLRFSCL